MLKFFSFFVNPWTLFALAVLSFSFSLYVPFMGMLIIWGIGLLIASVARFAFIAEAEEKKNRSSRY